MREIDDDDDGSDIQKLATTYRIVSYRIGIMGAG